MKFERLLKIKFSSPVFLLCGLVLTFAGCGGKPITTVTNEAEAIEIIDVLRQYNIASDKQPVGDEKNRQYEIVVEGDTFGGGDNYPTAIQVLHDHCLPHREPATVQEGSMIGSPEIERAKVQRQLKIGIIGQLRKLPGVTCVDVNFVPPQDQLAALEPYPATAAVTISYKTPEPSFTEATVKNLVAGSVPKLQPEKVNVAISAQPVRPAVQSNKSNLTRILMVVGIGLFVILGSVSLIYFMQKRRQPADSTALAVRDEGANEAEQPEP